MRVVGLNLLIAFVALVMADVAKAHGGGTAGHLHRVGTGALLTHGPDPAPRSSGSATARVAQAPAPWCGDVRSTDDTANEASPPYRFHAVYAVPSDRPARLSQVASGIQADAQSASSLFAARFGRGIRFDYGTRCGAANLDITTISLPEDTTSLERLAATPAGVLEVVARALDAAGLPTARAGAAPRGVAATTNYVVWLDGPAPEQYCGQATLTLDRRRSQDNGNTVGGKVAAIFRDGGGFCGASTVLHEVGHTLGAVQPRSSGGEWTGHCSDEAEDLMCDPSAPALSGPGAARDRLDAAHDDYWDPPSGTALGWWTLNLSRFICADADCDAAVAAYAAPENSKARAKARKRARKSRARATRGSARKRATAGRRR